MRNAINQFKAVLADYVEDYKKRPSLSTTNLVDVHRAYAYIVQKAKAEKRNR